MLRIGCTGGIGSGKSTVSALLTGHGAVLIDADELGRTASAPGGAAYGAIIERFGQGFVRSDGALDQGALAELVFSNREALSDLEAIIHPIVSLAITRQLAELDASDVIAIVDLALLVETGGRDRYRLDGVLVVDAPEELCIERLVTYRGFSEQDARRRISTQSTQQARLMAADFVILNIGTLDELTEMTEEAWRWIERLQKEHTQPE